MDEMQDLTSGTYKFTYKTKKAMKNMSIREIGAYTGQEVSEEQINAINQMLA